MAITLKVPPNKNDHIIGSLNAPIHLVEYGDLECPNTLRALSVTDKLIEDFRGSLCFVFRHFPLVEIHPNAAMAALATEAAERQGQFWKMLRHLLKSREKLTGHFIFDSARKLGLEMESYMKDMEDENLLLKIQQDLNSGEESGVSDETPVFFLNGIMVESPTNYDLLRQEIQNLLQENEMFP